MKRIKTQTSRPADMVQVKFRQEALLTSRVMRWMKTLGYQFPWFTGTIAQETDNIWSRFPKKGDPAVRKCLADYKVIRTWFWKTLGSNHKEASLLLSSPPKGITPQWQRILKEMRRLPHSNNWTEKSGQVRMWATLQFSTRLLTLPPMPDISPIVDPTPTCSDVRETYGVYVSGFWRELRRTKQDHVPKSCRFSRYHLTYKQGPNGPALTSAMEDFKCLSDEHIELLSRIGGEKLTHNLKFLKGTYVRKGKGRTRKLSYFSDMEGKTRLVGIGDYFTQTALRPLHFALFRILSKIPQDCTFDQDKAIRGQASWEDKISCDLTSATDLWPIEVITLVLKGWLPDQFVDDWERLMVGYPFEFKDSSGTTLIYYKKGNPMGFYSSWSSFTLCHHFAVYVACARLGLRWSKSKYYILGDDIIFGDPILYKEYRRILQDLSVPVSEAKSHQSKTLVEFAKRLVYKGVEVTPLPLPAFREAGTSYNKFVPLSLSEQRRGVATGGIETIFGYKPWLEIHQTYKWKKGLRLPNRRLPELWSKALLTAAVVFWWTNSGPLLDTMNEVKKWLPAEGLLEGWLASACKKKGLDPWGSSPEHEKVLTSSISSLVSAEAWKTTDAYREKFFAGLKELPAMVGTDIVFQLKKDNQIAPYQWHPLLGVYESIRLAWRYLQKARQPFGGFFKGVRIDPLRARKPLMDRPIVLRSIGLPTTKFGIGQVDLQKAVLAGRIVSLLYKRLIAVSPLRREPAPPPP